MMQIIFSGHERLSANFCTHTWHQLGDSHSWLEITFSHAPGFGLTFHEGTLSADQLRRAAAIFSEGNANDSHVECYRSREGWGGGNSPALHPDLPF